ncbi:MAG: ComFC, amidophosphoribosyltransferase [Candidatus Doudnabacteria bacterium]|nr:ComFC, amidophosphoribosyltransferase [Candidatus Doudnabacteria bacterium]
MLHDFKKSSQQLLDLLFPVACVSCSKYGKLVCDECFDSIRISKMFNPPKTTLAATNYGQKIVSTIVSNLKYDLLKDLDVFCAQIMFKFLQENNIVFDNASIITFVPMHYSKQQLRGFNQAELIAQKLSVILELPCFKILTKTKRTTAQMVLNREKRLINLKGTFESFNCAGKKIILIDDVITTGATFDECTKALYLAGAKEVRCFAFCRD